MTFLRIDTHFSSARPAHRQACRIRLLGRGMATVGWAARSIIMAITNQAQLTRVR